MMNRLQTLADLRNALHDAEENDLLHAISAICGLETCTKFHEAVDKLCELASIADANPDDADYDEQGNLKPGVDHNDNDNGEGFVLGKGFPFTVIYVEPSTGAELWQFFECHADDSDHAEEQCFDAYPGCTVLWVNTGHGPKSQTMEEQ